MAPSGHPESSRIWQELVPLVSFTSSGHVLEGIGTRFGAFPGALEGVEKRQDLQTLAPSAHPESSRIWQEMAPLVSFNSSGKV